MKKQPSKLFPVLIAVLVALGGYLAYPSLGGLVGGFLHPRARSAAPQLAARMPAANLQPGKPAVPPMVATPQAPVAPNPPSAVAGPAAGQPKPPAAGPATAAVLPKPATSAAESGTAAPQPTAGAKPTPDAPAAAPQPAAQPEAPLTSLAGTGQAGRTDPFSPLVAPPMVRAPTAGTPLPPVPQVGLPMPPGFTAPGGGTPGGAPDPAAGMTVTGIVGGEQRVAIVKADGGKTFIVVAGERIENAQVIRITEDKVVMKRDNVTFELVLGGERSS